MIQRLVVVKLVVNVLLTCRLQLCEWTEKG